MSERRRSAVHCRTEAGSAENRTKVVASTSELARDGDVVVPSGLKVANFLRTSAIHFNHNYEYPVAKPVSAALINNGEQLEVEIEWPPDGTSAKSDEVRRLVKADVLRAVSIGFLPLEMEPLDPKQPFRGQRILEADLLELSFTGCPADTGAIVTQRSDKGEADWKCGASRTLPIDDSDSWDGPAAEKAIFEWAGGEDFSPAKAKKAFLAYNAAKPKERGSYKLPIATVKDGRLTVPKGAIRAAASRLPQADIPANVQAEARAALDHYEEKADMGSKSDGDRASTAQARRLTKKVEGDLQAALKHHERAAVHHRDVGDQLGHMGKHLDGAKDIHEKARAAHADLGEALEAARSEPEKAPEHIERAIKLHGTLEKYQRAVRAAHADLEHAHEDADAHHDSLGRCMRAAHEAVKSAVEPKDDVPGDEDNATSTDGDSDAVQTSGGLNHEGGKTAPRSADWRKRRAQFLELNSPV